MENINFAKQNEASCIYCEYTLTLLGMELILSTSPMHCSCKTSSVSYIDLEVCQLRMEILCIFWGELPLYKGNSCLLNFYVRNNQLNINALYQTVIALSYRYKMYDFFYDNVLALNEFVFSLTTLLFYSTFTIRAMKS